MKKFGWPLLALSLLSLSATAQNAGPPRGDIAPNALRDAALTVAQAIDAGQSAQLWQSASAVTRGAMTQQEFVTSVAKSRQPLGQSVQRQWTGITLRDVTSQQGAAKPGRYGSVDFGTTFAGNRRGHELVSFRLDEDGQWRFAGYVVEALR